MTEAAPRLFDPARARRNLGRAKAEPSLFLADAVADEIDHRMNVIRRDFAITLIHGPHSAPGTQLVFDAECLPLAPESLDCIISLLTLQSANDLPGALIQMRRALRPDGLFLACLFGGATLCELRAAWLEAESGHRGGVTPRVAPFADVREMGNLLQRAGFALPVADSDRIVVRYPDALALMREIRAVGLANALADRSPRPVTAALLAKAVTAYAEHFSDPDGKIRATVEIVWLTAWAPHQSQQRALKPGSAKARLADALGTQETRLPR